MDSRLGLRQGWLGIWVQILAGHFGGSCTPLRGVPGWTTRSRKERQAKRHKQGPLGRASGEEQKASKGKERQAQRSKRKAGMQGQKKEGDGGKKARSTNMWERKEKLRRQRKLFLHQLRKRRHIGSEEP
eukprot:1150086-Pelagomonas_calceolata.AAC.2